MKESITKFDLEAAFKALDELDIPVAEKGIKANKPALTEIFSRKTKFDALMEEYYDISNMSELDDARTAREAEVAQAKLARIEKIVDLDAESPEDLLPSYVGKFIMQCPQCMTLFYKDPDDVEASEDDPATVNVNEVCQHCGNDSGYTLIGKVGAATEEERDEAVGVQEVDVDSSLDSDEQAVEETGDEEASDAGEEYADSEEPIGDFEDEEIDLDAISMEEEDDKKEESVFAHGTGEALVEALEEDVDLEVSVEDFEQLINTPEFKKPISDNETRSMLAELDGADNNGRVNESFFTKDCAIDGFDCAVVDEFEDAGVKGYNVCYSKNGVDLVTVEIWEDDSPIATIENHYAPYLFNPAYESFDDFANDLTYKIKKYYNDALTEAVPSFLYDDDVLSDRIVDVMHYGKFLRARWTKNEPIVTRLSDDTYRVEHYKGAGKVIVKFDMANKQDATLRFTVNGKAFATKNMLEAQDFILNELEATRIQSFNIDIDESVADQKAPLTEGNLLDLGKALGKKLKQTGKNIKMSISDAIDNFTDSVKTREEKADFILANAKENYTNVRVNQDGEMEQNADNKKFNTFIILGFDEKYSNGVQISQAPRYTNKDLVFSMERPEKKDNYKSADAIAKGWSMKDGNGPAHIYLAKDENDTNAAFLCSYFKGELKEDQLKPYFEAVKKDLKGMQLMKDGGADQAPDSAPEIEEKPETTSTAGPTTTTTTTTTTTGQNNAAQESLSMAISNVENLQESTLETLITKDLKESYKNVADFKLKNCSYLDEKLTVDGVIRFTSGNTRDTSYIFTEALFSKTGAITLTGINEKLGLNKRFTVSGYIDGATKTFISESFGHK